MNHKKLQLSQEKCFKMHVGKTTSECPILKVDGKEMNLVERETYLGDIVTSDGNLNENIEARFNKGIGIINQIIAILNEVSFGHFYFEMALLFRQSMLINSILCNFEVLHGLKKSHIEKMEAVDRYFMRRIFQSPISTPVESFYIETSVLPLKFVIIGRRLMYYHNLLQKDDSELVKMVFLTQGKLSVKNYWINYSKDDLSLYQIVLSENEIKLMKKEKFKKLVNDKLRQLTNEYFTSLQQSHRKTRNIFVTEKMKPYLRSEEISLEEKRMLFLMRNFMCDVKTNYKTLYANNMRCRLCDKFEESESHLTICEEGVDEEIQKNLKNVSVTDVWASSFRQITSIKIINKLFKLRNLKYEKKKLSTQTQVQPL